MPMGARPSFFCARRHYSSFRTMERIMRHETVLAMITAMLALGACGGPEEGSGGVTREEAEQLNEAAEMLDASPDSLVATDEAALGNGEQAAETGELPVVDEAATNAQ